MKPTIRNRFGGAMVGLLIGDIRSARYEHKRQAAIAAMLAADGGISLSDYPSPWKHDKGKIIRGDQPTDDSEGAARLAQALVHGRGTFNPEVIYDRQRLFMINRISTLAWDAIGEGSTLKAALEPLTYLQSLFKFGRGEVPVQPSNGALMRNTPMFLRYHGREDDLVRYSKWQSCVTHTHPLSQVACIAHSLMGSLLLDGLDPLEAWQKTQETLSGEKYKKLPERDAILDMVPMEISESTLWPDGKDHTGFVLHSLRIAIWAVVSSDNFHDGIEKCIRIGGDTDTYAAIAGGLLGAHFGHDGIPPEWLEVAQGVGIMNGLAAGLFELAHPHD